ncbi:MAG TPA: hypothetical protein VIV14_03460 [Gammaproteobacteria bacterium]
MRTILAALVATSFCSIACAQGWFEYINIDDYFIVNFPGEPVITQTTRMSAFEVEYPANVYTVENERGFYQIMVVDYRDYVERHRTKPGRHEANSSISVPITDVRASVAHEANNFRTRGGVVTYDAWADIDKIEGHQLQITNPDRTRSFISIHLHAGRLYVLEGRVPEGAPAPGIFQQSLGILDEEGRRIRYVIDIDGNRERMDVFHEWFEGDEDLRGEQIIEQR